jgi:hypothetical protein
MAAKMIHKTDKSMKKLKNFMFELLDVLFGGLKVSSVAWKSFMKA